MRLRFWFYGGHLSFVVEAFVGAVRMNIVLGVSLWFCSGRFSVAMEAFVGVGRIGSVLGFDASWMVMFAWSNETAVCCCM